MEETKQNEQLQTSAQGPNEGSPTPKSYSEAELQSEVDRRVNQALQNHKNEWQREFEEKAKLSAEERIKVELEGRIKGLEQREAELKYNTNLLSAEGKLAQAGVPEAQREKLLKTLVTTDGPTTDVNVTAFIEAFGELKTTTEASFKSQMSNVPPPSQAGTAGAMTKEAFDALGYDAKMRLKESNPEAFKNFIK